MDLDARVMHRALVDANRGRAHLYLAFLRVMEQRWGRDAALSVMREAIRSWGRSQGAALADGAGRRGARFGETLTLVLQPGSEVGKLAEAHCCSRLGQSWAMYDCP